MTKADLIKALHDPKTVMFTKVNGQTREGLFIINPDCEPNQYSNSDAVSVIECKTGAYKAIKARSVISINNEVV
jgi:hypothetical protein